MELALPRATRTRHRGVLRFIYAALILSTILLGLTQTAVLPAPLRLPRPAFVTASTRDARWREDVDYLADEIRRLHANAFFHTSRTEFDESVAALALNIPTMADHEIVIEMMRLVAMLGDGHTQVFNYAEAGGFRTYPLKLQWFGADLYVVAASPEYAYFIGMQVVQIGEHSPADASETVAPLIAHYNEYGLRKKTPRLLVTPEVLQTLGLIEDMNHAVFTVIDGEGSEFELDLMPVDAADTGIQYLGLADINPAMGELPLYLRHSDDNYWYSYLSDSQTLFLQYNSSHQMPSQPFKAFSDELFAFIDANPVERVVVDLRFNSGGYPAIFQPFLDALEDRPSLTGPGKLYVLIGNSTFSSGMWHALALHNLGGVLVGEPTSGKPNAFGHVRRYVLPNSGIGIQYSTWYWRLVDEGDPAAVMPDIYIEPTIRDYLSGRDVVLDLVLDNTVKAQ